MASEAKAASSRLVKADTLRRLRLQGAPVTLFGETWAEKRRRAERLEESFWCNETLALGRDGCLRVSSLLDGPACKELLALIRETETEPPSAQDGDRLPAPALRRCVRLEHKGIVADAVATTTARLRPLLTEYLGPKFRLVELGAITSLPGAPRQEVHQDDDSTGRYAVAGHSPVLTIFMALQDISLDMGPSEVYLGSHTAEVASRILAMEKEAAQPWAPCPDFEEFLSSHSTLARMGPLVAGNGFLMDRRAFHCGGANRSQHLRSLFHFSFMSATGEVPETLRTSSFYLGDAALEVPYDG